MFSIFTALKNIMRYFEKLYLLKDALKIKSEYLKAVKNERRNR